MVAERLLARRVREREERGPTDRVTFDTLATGYLDDYVLRRLRTLDTARGRVANLRAVFGGWEAMRITTEAIRDYQRARRTTGAAAATVNRETSALSRMFHLGVRAARLAQRPIFPERLDENGPRQGFFEHAEYKAVRRHLPRPYQDVLDFAYFSGWRKREILELRWDEVGAPLVFTREDTTVRAWRRAWPAACRQAGVPGRLLHDCRRTTARNLVRAGVPERVAMVLTGHQTRAIFDRYCIVNEADLHHAGAQLVTYLGGTDTSVA